MTFTSLRLLTDYSENKLVRPGKADSFDATHYNAAGLEDTSDGRQADNLDVYIYRLRLKFAPFNIQIETLVGSVIDSPPGMSGEPIACSRCLQNSSAIL